MKKSMLALLLLLAMPVSCWAQLTIIEFGELPPQSVDGLTFRGVTFGFGPGVATFDAPNGGQLTYVQDPSLEGPSNGTLTLTFAKPAPMVEFGVALSTSAALTPGFTVSLTGPSGPLGTFPVNTTNLKGFTEAKFSYAGTPVTQATIVFDSGLATAFALDNLTFGTPIVVPTLAVGSLALLALVVAALGAGLLRRRSRM